MPQYLERRRKICRLLYSFGEKKKQNNQLYLARWQVLFTCFTKKTPKQKTFLKWLVKRDTFCSVPIIQIFLFSPLTFPAHKWQHWNKISLVLLSLHWWGACSVQLTPLFKALYLQLPCSPFCTFCICMSPASPLSSHWWRGKDKCFLFPLPSPSSSSPPFFIPPLFFLSVIWSCL